MLATPEELKAHSPALASLSDAALVGVLTAVSEYVQGETGPLLAADFPVTFKVRKSNFSDGSFLIGTKYAMSLTEVEGVAYAGVLDTDYWIDGNEVTVPGFYPVTQHPFFTVKVAGGLASVPKDLKHAVLTLASIELTKENGRQVASYSLGPRSVTFDSENEIIKKIPNVMSALRIIRSYTPPRP